MTRLWVDKIRDFIHSRRLAYVQTFASPTGQVVLADLARFCRANKTTFNADPRLHAVAEGRREVFLRIQEHLRLTDEQLWALYAPAPSPQVRSNDDE